VIAAEVGYDDLALEYFHRALYLDLGDSHQNTSEGVHVASTGGVWACMVHGFAGLVDHADYLEFTPRLPVGWEGVTFHLLRHGSKLRVDVDPDGLTVTVVSGNGVPLRHGESSLYLAVDEQYRYDRC
jgi:alpha,alpha-trehalose phosphorylase